MNLLDLVSPEAILQGPLVSWLLLSVTAALAALGIITLLWGLARGSLGLFVLALSILAVAGWLFSWMMGWHNALAFDYRLAGWVGTLVVLAVMTVAMSRALPTLPGLLVAMLPILTVLGIADVTAGRSPEWRLVGADRESIARDLGLEPLLETSLEGLGEPDDRPSWPDVAEAWRNYAEETRKLDEAIDRPTAQEATPTPAPDQIKEQ